MSFTLAPATRLSLNKQVKGGGTEDIQKELRRRDRDFYDRYTDTLPPGVERPEQMRKRGAAVDETGGPPTRQ